MSKKFRGNILLLITSIIWGSAFVAQVVGMDHIGPFAFNAVRNLIASLFLLILIPFLNQSGQKKKISSDKNLLYGGIACGIILFIASSLQQIGLQYTTASKAGFITTLYIVIVPLFTLFLGKKVGLKLWLCVLIAGIGFYLLTVTDQLTIEKGDLLIFLCAIVFSLHIIVIDYFSPKVDGVKMSCIQFLIVGVINTICMLSFESFSLESILQASVPILYTGILSSGIGYTFQIIAQKDTDPTIASLILSLESVFALLAGVWLLSDPVNSKQLWGCALIFAAIVIAQLPQRKKQTA